MTPAAAGVWIAAILGFSAPLTAAIAVVAIRNRRPRDKDTNCDLAYANKENVAVLQEQSKRTTERLKGIDEKLGALATIEAQLTLLVKANGGGK